MTEERIRQVTALVAEVFEVKASDLGRARLSGVERDARAVIFGLLERVFFLSSVELADAWGCSYSTAKQALQDFAQIEPGSDLQTLLEEADNRVRSWISAQRQPFLD